MIKVKDLLYVNSAGNSNSSIVSGDIDLKSLVQGEDFWQFPYKQSDKDKKTLVYHSWFMNDKSKALYYRLKEEGFEIYFRRANGTYSKNPFLEKSLSIEKLGSEDEIAIDFIQKMPDLKLTRDEVQILDYKLIRNLIDDPEKEYPEICSLFISDIKPDSIHASDIMDYEARTNIGLKIIDDIKGDSSAAEKLASIAKIKNFDIEVETTHLKLDSNTLDHSKEDILNLDPISIESLEISSASSHAPIAIKRYSQNLKKLKIYNYTLHVNEVADTIITSADLSYNNIGAKGVIALAEALKKNTSINNSINLQRTSDNIPYEDLSFPNLEELHLYQETISEKHRNLFGKNLKILVLRNGDIGNIDSIDIEFPNLESINFSEIGMIDDKNLDLILSKTGDKLAQLFLGNIRSTDYIPEGEYYFPKLRNLSFSKDYFPYFINPSLVRKIFRATGENLEYLEISEHVNLKDIDCDILSFPNLKALSIHCKNDNIDLLKIRKLLESSSDNLASIKITGDIDTLETLDISDIDFPNLRVIEIYAFQPPKSSSVILKFMEKTADELESLSIAVMNLPDSADLEKYSFTNLNQLSLASGEYNRQSLEVILTSAKDSIQSLELSKVSWNDDKVHQRISLPKLEELRWDAVKICDNFLNNLVDAARDTLRQIKISNFGEAKFNFNSTSFPKLEIIDLSFLQVRSEDLWNLLKSCHQSIKEIYMGQNYLPDKYLEELAKLDFPKLVRYSTAQKNSLGEKTTDFLYKISKANIGDDSDDKVMSEDKIQSVAENTQIFAEKIKTPLVNFEVAEKPFVKGNLNVGAILKAKPIFYTMNNIPYNGIAMNHARIKPYDYLDKTTKCNTINSAFFIASSRNQEVEECNIVRGKLDDFDSEEGKSYVKVLIDQFPISSEYRFLPSLSRREEIALLESEEDIEFEYDKYHGFYKIRAASGDARNIELKYIMKIPDDIAKEFNDSKNNHSEEIQKLIDELQNFTGSELIGVSEKDTKSAEEWIDLFYSQKVGSCIHRAIIFKYKLENIFVNQHYSKYEVNLINNGIHAFCEYRINPLFAKEGEDCNWKSVDLGGINVSISLQKNELEEAKEYPALDEEKSKAESKPLVPLEKIYSTMKDGIAKKYLLKLFGARQLQDAETSIAIIADSYHDEIFKVKSSKDLICSKPVISKDEGYEGDSDIGKVDEFGGALYDYIQRAKEDITGKKYIITINLSNFTPSEIVRYNTIFDESPSIDGVAIPDNVTIFALTNPYSINYYNGFDFVRRFDKNIYEKIKIDPLTKIDFIEEEEILDSPEIINLYEQSNWQDILFGKWIIEKGKIKYIHGELTSKLKSGAKEFHIRNANWDEEFTNFWTKAAYDKYFIHDNIKYHLPVGFKIKKSHGYDLNKYKDYISFEEGFDATIQTINPSYIYLLFNGYRPNPAKNSMEIEDGLIKQNTGGTLRVNLTRKLDESIWGKILDNCKKHNTRLEVHFHSKEQLPSFVEISEFVSIEAKNDRDIIISSKDPGYEALKFAEENISPLIIDISEVAAKNIIGTISGHYLKDKKEFVFEEKKGFLEERLASGQTIILKGKNISSETKDALSKLLIARSNLSHDNNSKLILVTDNVIGLEGAVIKESVRLDSDENVTQYDAIRHLDMDSSAEQKETSSEKAKIDFKTSKAKAEEFQQVRIEKLDQLLAYNPYVWLYGDAGVGKTRFVSDYAKMKGANLHEGYETIENWARDDSSSYKFLFIDEANLKNTDYTIFESMFSYYNKKPVILLENEIIELDDNHKVIFAGNPTHYGNHRKMPALLEQHGGTVTFHALPIYFIYEKMLKDIFGQEEEILGQKITTLLDDIYDFFNNNLKVGAALLTPREISHLALISYNKIKAGIEPDLFEIAYKYYGNRLSLKAASKYKEKYSIYADDIDKESFCLQSVSEKIEYKDSKGKEKIYEIVPSRKDVFSILEDMVLLRKTRMQYQEETSNVGWVSKAGQFGVILEGNPKTGKSEMIRASLSKHNLKEGEDWLYLPVSMQNNIKRELLTKAMEEGKIVMIDELNSVALDEEFMNQILDGKEKHPGFAILATQNPAIFFKGRFNIPEALSSRMIKQQMPDYTKSEKRHIFGFDETNIEIDELCSAIYRNLLEKDELKDLISAAKEQNILDQKNQFGQTIFEVAKEAGNINAIIILAQAGIELSQEMIDFFASQTCRYILEGDKELVEQLMPFVDLNWHNEYGQTIGDVVAANGMEEYEFV